ncbi:MAG: non-canonical purine NTP pyrophosphatase [Cyanothece sp. SIO1E1]|nr:non-canonical purine NTP pyrophosphatase [Cyanothece sp. SIO1E1]
MEKSVIFVTGSSSKRTEAKRILGFELQHCDLDLPEIQAVELEDVIMRKATFAYEALKHKPVLVEDTGLFIEAWNGLPGALIKWFMERVGVAGICKMADAFPSRKALAKTVIGIYDGQLQVFSGEIEGRISSVPRGETGFGWDKIFIPNGSEKTFAEMSPEEKDKYSMRRLAFEALKSK